MESNEIIKISLPKTLFDKAVNDSLDYALLSIPFTFNRMKINDLSKRIINIAKGKLSEIIFKEFCINNDIPIKVDLCETPFYMPDKKDFILGNEEWDLKNNFLYHDGPILMSSEYMQLPAFVPNRGKWDQWSKKNILLHPTECDESIFLFSFMKGWDLKDKKRDNPFLSFQITKDQSVFLESLQRKYQRKKFDQSPIKISWFWEQMKERSSDYIYHSNLAFRPALILMGYSSKKEWKQFDAISPNTFKSNYFSIRIKNMGASFLNLKSFISLYPHLYEKMTFGVSFY